MSDTMNIPLLLSLLFNRITIPKDFRERVKAVEEMLEDDSSGLVDSLTDFMVDSAITDITIETGNENLNEILNEKWFDKLNSQFRGQGVETGIKGLLKEYLKERWKGASFPVLKIVNSEEIDGISLPTSMIFADGGSIYAKDKDKNDKVNLLAYNYYIGKDMDEEIKGEAYFMYKIGCRWSKKYPNPFLIRRGIYQNWQIINSLKNKELKVLNQIIPYIMQVLRGSPELATQKDVTYDLTELEEVKKKIQELIDRTEEKELSITGKQEKKVPIRVSNFDEQIKHLIPDLINIFKTELFASAEKNILGGLGFIDIAEGVSVSRRESILNPKVFIAEVNRGIEDFKLILKDVIDLIKEKNSDEDDINHPKYVTLKWKIVSEPITEFLTREFLELMRGLSDRGLISNETMTKLVGRDYELEKIRRERELENGDDILMYPKPIQNQEDKGLDFRGDYNNPKKKVEKEVPEDRKKGTPETRKFNQAKMELTGAPYDTIKDLPSRVTNNMTIGLQRVFMRVFNQSYKKYGETRAFKIAWSVVKKLGKKIDGKWTRTKAKVNGKIRYIRLNRAMVEEIIKEGEEDNV